jgi:hypothetical protein
MEHTTVNTPKGSQRQQTKIENLEQKINEAIEFVRRVVHTRLIDNEYSPDTRELVYSILRNRE